MIVGAAGDFQRQRLDEKICEEEPVKPSQNLTGARVR